MSKRKPKLVHLTHHSCIANGLKPIDMSTKTSGYSSDLNRDTYGHYAPHLAGYGHLHCRWSNRNSLVSTDLDAVTCATCLAGLAAETPERLLENAETCHHASDSRWYEKRAEHWCDHKELKVRAWMLCCRHVGAPCPLSRRQIIKRLREARASVAYNSVRGANWGRTWIKASLSSMDLEKALEKIDPADRKLMRGVIREAKRADALLAKVAQISESIDVIARRAATQIRKGATVTL
jgi:hypothetical protein